MSAPLKIPLRDAHDAGRASQSARRLAEALGFNACDQALIATAVSELCVNVNRYAERGSVAMGPLERAGRRGFEATVRDRGAGIACIDDAMREGHSSGDSLGMGLPGVKRMMDEFTLRSEPGVGTVAVIRKFLPPRKPTPPGTRTPGTRPPGTRKGG